MRMLNRRLVRELWRTRGPVLSIAAVVAVGIMTVLTLRGTYQSLVTAQAEYYSQTRFPDAWAVLESAPEAVLARISAVDGVTSVSSRVGSTANLFVPGLSMPALGRVYSVPADRRRSLSDLHLTSGRYVQPNRGREVILSDKFAAATDYQPGDTLAMSLNGIRFEALVVGTAISPEHTYAVPPGSLYPDDERYGIVWMDRDALGPLLQLDGAFNEVLIQVETEAALPGVLAAVDRILEPFGGQGAYPRAEQASHFILQAELDSNRATSGVIPAVFLGIAAFLLHMVLSRMIATERTEIAVLKAFGYSDWEVGGYYFRFALAAVFLGALVGIGAGVALGQSMVELYGQFFGFPELVFIANPGLVLVALVISVLAATAGALSGVRRAVKLPPAEAMRPEPPASFKPGPVERLGIGKLVPPAARMILRNVERTPVRSGLSALGVAYAVAILVVGMFMFDGVDLLMRLQFDLSQREDISVTFNRPVGLDVTHALGGLDGVQHVETVSTAPVRFVHGPVQEENAILGLPAGSALRHVVGRSGRRHPIPVSGVVMSRMLADQLRLEPGTSVTMEFLDGERRRVSAPVAGVVEDFLGLSAYMDREALNRLRAGPPSANMALLRIDDGAGEKVGRQLRDLPVVASVASPAQMLASFQKQMDESLLISVFFILGFSCVIAVAVIYNGARIALSERGRELASLRVLGFTEREVSTILLGEQGLITLTAIPIGWAMGYALAFLTATAIQNESYRVPMVVDAGTFLWAAGITIAAGVLSGLIVRRRLHRMDLIKVLKTRE